MRVISGSAKGRALKAPPGMNTRPTSDKVKEAIFNMIGPYFDGGMALDLFAGSGGLGIEALSRGMDRAVFVDMDKLSIQTINRNLEATGFSDRSEVYRSEAAQAIRTLAKRKYRFDLVLLDPPYRFTHVDELMLDIQELGLLQDGATVLVEHRSDHRYPEIVGQLQCRRYAEYGETAVAIYRYVDASGPSTS